MSVISRDVGQYVARNQSIFDADKRDQIIAFAEQLGLPETMGSQGKYWHLSASTLDKFAAAVRQSRSDLLARHATKQAPSHLTTQDDPSGSFRIVAGDYFDRLPPEERLRLANSHTILRADDGTVTLQRR